jgi:hypothetical protein
LVGWRVLSRWSLVTVAERPTTHDPRPMTLYECTGQL